MTSSATNTDNDGIPPLPTGLDSLAFVACEPQLGGGAAQIQQRQPDVFRQPDFAAAESPVDGRPYESPATSSWQQQAAHVELPIAPSHTSCYLPPGMVAGHQQLGGEDSYKSGVLPSSLGQQSYTVAVPQGLTPGSFFDVSADGLRYSVEVPADALPGTSFAFSTATAQLYLPPGLAGHRQVGGGDWQYVPNGLPPPPMPQDGLAAAASAPAAAPRLRGKPGGKSESAKAQEAAAREAFDKLRERTEAEPLEGRVATYRLLGPEQHLTAPCWSDFNKFVKDFTGWRASRCAASEEEKTAAGATHSIWHR
jgi:hypothetical protein